jgi:CRISPR-associated protein Cas1
MAWKGLHLTQAARLSLADGQCCVKRDDGEVRIAIEDLAWIVVEARAGNDCVTLLVAAETAAQSLVRAFEEEKTDRLILPALEPARELELAP